MQIEWTFDGWTSVAYAAWRIQQGDNAAKTPLMLAVAEHVPAVDKAVRSLDDPSNANKAWRQLPLLASQKLTPAATANQLAASGRGEPQLVQALESMHAAAAAASPEFESRLGHRVRPLRDAWEAVGPGMLRQIAQQVGGEGILVKAGVTIVEPVRGGGESYPEAARVLFEGLLANLHPALPETMRLAWRLTLLDGAGENELLRLPCTGKLAMIPPTLAAAEQLGISRADAPTRRAAVAAWLRERELPASFSATCDVLDAWWESTTTDDATTDDATTDDARWPAAVVQLDRRLAAEHNAA